MKKEIGWRKKESKKEKKGRREGGTEGGTKEERKRGKRMFLEHHTHRPLSRLSLGFRSCDFLLGSRARVLWFGEHREGPPVASDRKPIST